MSHANGFGHSLVSQQSTHGKHGRSLSQQSASGTHETYTILSQNGRSGATTSGTASRAAGPGFPGPHPGSFSSDLRSTATVSRLGYTTPGSPLLETPGNVEQTDYFGSQATFNSDYIQSQLRDKIEKETKIKVGSENLLEALVAKGARQAKEQQQRVESELQLSNRKLLELNKLLDAEVAKSQRTLPSTISAKQSLKNLHSPLKTSRQGNVTENLSPDSHEIDTESPSLVFDEILQALELEGMQPDYYVARANRLVELIKRHGSLKYDLAWSIFGLRVQTMLLSESREVIAAGYRVTRHAIADLRSLQIIRSLQTDQLVVLSLLKESKASMEREQALKFVRAFLEVKGGVQEVASSIIRSLVAISEQREDRLSNLAILTLAEMLLQDPSRLVSLSAISPLVECFIDGSFPASESLAAVFIRLEDSPVTRPLLRSGLELDSAFSMLTDSSIVENEEEKTQSTIQLLSSILKSWPGIFSVARQDYALMRSLLQSLQYDKPFVQSLVLDLLSDVLNISLPTWASTFLAGRRLTTYGQRSRTTSERLDELPLAEDLVDSSQAEFSMMEHFTSLLLAILIDSGLIEALISLGAKASDAALRRKAYLLLGEILLLADHALSPHTSARIQALSSGFSQALESTTETSASSDLIYQIERVGKTMEKSETDREKTAAHQQQLRDMHGHVPSPLLTTGKLPADLDELKFRAALVETQVLMTTNHLKWRWDLINDLIAGPLILPRRMEEAIKGSQFMKRILGFYRPFKYRFSEIRNTKANQRYVRTACGLMRTLLMNAEGIILLSESKMLRQLAECLAQLNHNGSSTATNLFFSQERIAETLAGGYFAIMGTLSSSSQGLTMLERWRMFSAFYHVLDLNEREDIGRLLLANLDFSIHSHLRVILSKGLTACGKDLRVFATGLLRRYAINNVNHLGGKDRSRFDAVWAIQLLVTQLYDPDVQVAEIAVQILQEVCNSTTQLEYVVQCRPALDHLGAIGAPLLLRFLSTSAGYQYLNDLDYITQEMDDWFLGRNEDYVSTVEASLARAFSSIPARAESNLTESDSTSLYRPGIVPPHFYRELARTTEGCNLLRDSGHFNEFAETIRTHWAECIDPDLILKIKGCLWAVGNIGAMDLGVLFLEESEIIPVIVQMANHSLVMTLRGTAFFTLGLVSRSLHGLEILLEYGWTAAIDDSGRSSGNCLPIDLASFLTLNRNACPSPESQIITSSPTTYSHDSQTAPHSPPHPQFDYVDDPTDPESATRSRVLTIVVDLSNTVLTKRAATELYAIKNESPELFSSIRLFRDVMHILERVKFRLQIRRFVIDLFDKTIIRRLVLEDGDNFD